MKIIIRKRKFSSIRDICKIYGNTDTQNTLIMRLRLETGSKCSLLLEILKINVCSWLRE